jgi:uncharacterized protein YkwD
MAAGKYAMHLAHQNQILLEHGEIVDRIRSEGVSFALLGELLGTASTVEELIKAWLAEESQHDILLGPFTHAGFAYSVATDNRVYWVLDLAVVHAKFPITPV